MPSGNGDNDVFIVTHGNTSTGCGGATSISNKMLSWNDNCLPSGDSDNDVSILAHGNTAMSQRKKRTPVLCKWTEGCSKCAKNNTQRFCKQHYDEWISEQAKGGGAPAINNDTIDKTKKYLPLGTGDSDVANQGSGGHNTSIGSANAMIINEDCNNDNANVSPSTLNRVQGGNVVNAT